MSEGRLFTLDSAETAARIVMDAAEGDHNPSTSVLGPLLAELDRYRAPIASLLAECKAAEARSPYVVGGRLPAIVPVSEIRALLGKEER